MIRSFNDKRPKIHKDAFLHDASEVIGSVRIGKDASIWPMAVLRGDVGDVVVGDRTNIQDGAVVHCRENAPSIIGKGVTVGHAAIVHGARIGDRCLVGMGATVMEATVGRECLIGAGAVVLAGAKIPARSLVLGSPARVVRKLKPEEVRMLKGSEDSYVALMKRHKATSRVVGR